MQQLVDNAIIMAAGFSSRFTAMSGGTPKALATVRGEVLIERQLCQLMEAGIQEIYMVLGHDAKRYHYLAERFPVQFIYNPDYRERNNNSSIYAARNVLRNSYICSADNYFSGNPFERSVSGSYYAAVYAEGETKEWCLDLDEHDVIRGVTVGGRDSWYMMGHAYWDQAYSMRFKEILEEVYPDPSSHDLYWEDLYIRNLDTLHMVARKYTGDEVFEFDTVEELLLFDPEAMF